MSPYIQSKLELWKTGAEANPQRNCFRPSGKFINIVDDDFWTKTTTFLSKTTTFMSKTAFMSKTTTFRAKNDDVTTFLTRNDDIPD